MVPGSVISRLGGIIALVRSVEVWHGAGPSLVRDEPGVDGFGWTRGVHVSGLWCEEGMNKNPLSHLASSHMASYPLRREIYSMYPVERSPAGGADRLGRPPPPNPPLAGSCYT